MSDRIENLEVTLRERMKREGFEADEVGYFAQNLHLKPLSVITHNLFVGESRKEDWLVLDAGCGIGLFSFLAYCDRHKSHLSLSIIGVDLDSKRLRFANSLLKDQHTAHWVRSSIGNLPFVEKAFDTALVHDLFCWVDYFGVVSDLAKTTMESIYFDIPNMFFYSVFPFLRPNPSYVAYSLTRVAQRLQRLGFDVVETLPAPLLYLTRRLRIPSQGARLLFSFLLKLPQRVLSFLCRFWPLVIVHARCRDSEN
jgi:SAM-dependent methyltransferase